MKLLFLTQNRSLNVFHALHRALDARAAVSQCGYVVADSWYYQNWTQSHPEFERSGHRILKEWELTGAPPQPDLALLRSYEKRLREPNLMRSILVDRRLSMGWHCSFAQDYRRRFSDDQLLGILQNGLVALDRLFDDLKPDAVIGFICVTFLDHLAFLFARARGIRFLNLRFARIADRMLYASSLADPAPEFASRYLEILESGSPRLHDARQFLQQARASNQLYEGVFKTSHKTVRTLGGWSRPLSAALRQIVQYWRYRQSIAVRDNHVPDPMVQLLYGGVVNPFRAWRQSRTLSRHYVQLDDLRNLRFAFLPFHTEPEVSLLLYGRPFMNQIEVARAFAESLPPDMFLVAKEHPWMIGKRPTAYYRTLLTIPKVKLAHPGVPGADLIHRADLLATISGSAALEAVIHRKPAVVLGDVPFTLMPPAMITRGSDLARLPAIVRTLLATHTHDETALEAFIATVFEQSESLHWYSTLLERAEFSNVRDSNFAGEVQALADFTLARLAAGTHPSAVAPANQ